MKRGIVCLLVFTLLFSFAACGSGQSSENGDQTNVTDAAKSETSTPQAVVKLFLEACAKGDHEAYKAVLSEKGDLVDDETFYDFSGELKNLLNKDGGAGSEAVNVELRIKETRTLQGDSLAAYMQENYEATPGDYNVTQGTVLLFESYLNGQEIDDDCFAFVTLENGAWKLMDFAC